MLKCQHIFFSGSVFLENWTKTQFNMQSERTNTVFAHVYPQGGKFINIAVFFLSTYC